MLPCQSVMRLFIIIAYSLLPTLSFCFASAQRARYSDKSIGYDAATPLLVGKRLHVWSGTAPFTRTSATKITLRLQVFDADMKTVTEKKIPLGKVNYWSMDFIRQGRSYVAVITLHDTADRQIRYTVMEDGEVSPTQDSSHVKRLRANSYFINEYTSSLNSLEDAYVADISDTIYQANQSVKFVNGDSCIPGEKYQRIRITKTNKRTRAISQLLIGSVAVAYTHPVLQLKDDYLFFSAMSAPAAPGHNNRQPTLLMATVGKECTASDHFFMTVQSTGGAGIQRFYRADMSWQQSKLLLIGFTVMQRDVTGYQPELQGGSYVQVPYTYPVWIAKAVNLMLIDTVGLARRDIVIDVNGDHQNLVLEELYSTEQDKRVDLFVARRFDREQSGITHFTINNEGDLSEEELIVDVRNHYRLLRATSVGPGILIVPYWRGSRNGLMQLRF